MSDASFSQRLQQCFQAVFPTSKRADMCAPALSLNTPTQGIASSELFELCKMAIVVH